MVINYFSNKKKEGYSHKIIMHANSKQYEISGKELKKLCISYFSDLCSYTHATVRAQQLPTPEDNFYEEWRETLESIAGLFDVFAEVFDQYFDVVWHQENDRTLDQFRIEVEGNIQRGHLKGILTALNEDSRDSTYFLTVAFSEKWEFKRRKDYKKTL